MIGALKEAAISLSNAFLSVIMPPFCQACRTFLEVENIFCQECLKKIRPLASVDLMITPSMRCAVWAISEYVEPLRSLILAKTFSNIVAAKQLGQLIWQMTPVKQNQVDIIIPIPLHWQREAKRGYNQAYEMARVLAQHKNVPCVKLLKRIAKTKYQAHVSYDERSENVKNVFALSSVNKQDYYNKHILLVDDLMTTGSTVKEAVKVLKKLQPASVTIVVACRVV